MEDLVPRERGMLASGGDVRRETTATELERQKTEVPRAMLELDAQPDEIDGAPSDPRGDRSALPGFVEGNDLHRVSSPLEACRDHPESQVLLGVCSHQCDAHARPEAREVPRAEMLENLSNCTSRTLGVCH
jgi:hypothetical protein